MNVANVCGCKGTGQSYGKRERADMEHNPAAKGKSNRCKGTAKSEDVFFDEKTVARIAKDKSAPPLSVA